MMHSVYLPFPEEKVRRHFADVKRNGGCKGTADGHIVYYENSIKRYEDYLALNSDQSGRTITEMRFPCQIEKDEKFWTASCLMAIYHGENRTENLTRLLSKAYGPVPPCFETETWEDCFAGNLHLFFEPNLPSPKAYQSWLQKNIKERHFIPYVLDSNSGRKNLEGATNVDALLLNETNGFAVVIEAKVLSDISYQITNDVMRNQIARNVDVMLEKNTHLCPPLDERDPAKTLFLLLTPDIFRGSPGSRLYGYKFNEYKSEPSSLARDLPHRKNVNWENLSKKLGWLTWEDFKHETGASL